LIDNREVTYALDLRRHHHSVRLNSGFGTVFGVIDGKSLPVCDYACRARLPALASDRRAVMW
jgi:hypothetical protein